jgi:hypothetical protein
MAARPLSDLSEVPMTSPTCAPPAGLDSLAAFEAEVSRLRTATFELSEAAREVLGHGFTGVHVHLQTAANELGDLQRLLLESRR